MGNYILMHSLMYSIQNLPGWLIVSLIAAFPTFIAIMAIRAIRQTRKKDVYHDKTGNSTDEDIDEPAL